MILRSILCPPDWCLCLVFCFSLVPSLLHSSGSMPGASGSLGVFGGRGEQAAGDTEVKIFRHFSHFAAVSANFHFLQFLEFSLSWKSWTFQSNWTCSWPYLEIYRTTNSLDSVSISFFLCSNMRRIFTSICMVHLSCRMRECSLHGLFSVSLFPNTPSAVELAKVSRYTCWYPV